MRLSLPVTFALVFVTKAGAYPSGADKLTILLLYGINYDSKKVL
jgi:hypothetical protein